MPDISTIILTKNEEIHIRRCIENCTDISSEVFVVDSFSNDQTCEIAAELGAKVIQNEWPGNQAEQFNWALENLPINTDWILRLDADEYLLPELKEEIKAKLQDIQSPINGIVFKRRHYFMGQWIKKGTYPIKILRLFRPKKGKYQNTWMDEHIKLTEGKKVEFDHDFVDHNLNNLGWWIDKHNHYSVREAAEYFDWKYGILEREGTQNKFNAQKESYYNKPLFLRTFFYFVYRYFIKLGFTEGKEGFLWHFLQGWWYRTLVDAKIFEIKQVCGEDPRKIKEYLREQYGLDL